MVFLALFLLLMAALLFVNAQSVPKARGPMRSTGVILILMAIAALLRSAFVIVPAGHVGVIDFWGNVSDLTLKSGFHLVNPLAKVVPLSIKTRESKEEMSVPSKEGLSVRLEISVLYHLDPEKASQIYKTVGEGYAETILTPQFRSIARGVTASFDAKALYTSEREKLAGNIRSELEAIVGARGIVIEATPLRAVILPPGLTQAIEQKLQAEQESQRMQFILVKEQQEAERKRIEAQGIADYQLIVSKGLNELLLRWKGIEATERLATSPNAKTVVIGAGKDGMPLILGNQ